MDTLKILVVDDEARMRKLVKDFLVRKDYGVLEAGDGVEALDIFFSTQNIALIILDVMMPKMDGWEVCREIRKESKVPIIMLTAKTDERDEQLGFDLGVDDYISKPFSPKILVARVEAILRSLVDECQSEKDHEKIRELHTYLFSNWEAAVNRFREDMTGSCTEGQVSHVLSERFSRNPMGWSEEGLGKLSKLRVFCKNGGEITASHFKSSFKCAESYKAYADRYLEEQKKDYDLSWMNDLTEQYVFDTASGTQQAIKMLGRIRSDVLC